MPLEPKSEIGLTGKSDQRDNQRQRISPATGKRVRELPIRIEHLIGH